MIRTVKLVPGPGDQEIESDSGEVGCSHRVVMEGHLRMVMEFWVCLWE